MFAEWLFWISLWWVFWFLILIEWYSRGVKARTRPKMHPLEAFFLFLYAGSTPIIIMVTLFTKQTKR